MRFSLQEFNEKLSKYLTGKRAVVNSSSVYREKPREDTGVVEDVNIFGRLLLRDGGASTQNIPFVGIDAGINRITITEGEIVVYENPALDRLYRDRVFTAFYSSLPGYKRLRAIPTKVIETLEQGVFYLPD